MTFRQALSQIREVRLDAGSPLVCRTVADEIRQRSGAAIVEGPTSGAARPGVFRIRITGGPEAAASGNESRLVRLTLGTDGSGLLECPVGAGLFGAAMYAFDVAADEPLPADGVLHLQPTFAWNRSCYDIFLTQEARIQHGLDRDAYVRRLALSGFTHIEVNGLAYPMGLETGPKGEVYPMFYTYCPALDQFVDSSLNRGLYPPYYLSANLAYLEQNAALARKYGLVPGLLCFEPRSVPEEFFARYPMLRGARVDHPFRSFKPRYTMTLAHPRVRAHYAEMIRSLLARVPDLGFLTIWTNDSGSGFEHTTSLYVGRNGGPYMVREWRDHDAIARVAGEHALLFFRTLRDAAREVSPGFRVITRLESFMGEHETLWKGLGEGVEVETTSLVARGWQMPYTHPRYPDSHSINGGTVFQLAFDERERTLLADLRGRSATAHFYTAVGPHQMFAPLVGVPYPALTHKRLALLHANGVGELSQVGGTCPPGIVPFNVNHEILRRFQFDPGMDIDAEIARLARAWAGDEDAPALVEAWRLAEEAILSFPNICTLYSTIGFAWYRLWARPFVPDIEAIAADERAYYERFMCTTPHNPNNVDLSRDVLFRLVEPGQAAKDVERMDANVWPPLDAAIARLEPLAVRAPNAATPGVITDQFVRLKALRCWLETQRNLAAWVAGVYGWLDAADESSRTGHRARLAEAIAREMENSRRLLTLVDGPVEFMATTDLGESPLIHGRNLKALLATRLDLMERHKDDTPHIDHDYMMRMAGQVME
jgi:hypothetical protein